MFSNLYKYLFLSVSLAFIFQPSFNQDVVKTDSLLVRNDTLRNDTLKKDTTLHKRVQVSDFKSKLTYTATDSTVYSADLKKAYLYGNAKVNYEDIELTANYIEYDFTNNMVFAKGLPDSTGTIKGEPEFKQGSESFNAQTLTYNFKTKKGIIYKISTKQGDGFLLANKTKREANGIINLKGGKYTTCDLPDPHFYLALTKAVVVPGDKIVSGPAYFVLEDVPIFPVFIPFGFFPNKKKNTSGILMPTYGQEATRGYFLTDGGYYFAINDYFDFTIRGDIYSRGGWGAGLQTRYKKIYKYSGNINIRYNLDKTGEKGLDLRKTNNYSITWNHTQDQKANPSRQFSANVDFKTSSYDQRFNYNDPTKVINNTTSSGISYRKTWTNFALSLTARASQTTSSKTVDMTLPSMSFTTTQGFYPFKKKSSVGVPKWYENIKFTYSAEAQNRMLSSQDEMFTKPVLRRAQNGFHHSVPLSTSIKFLRFFNFSPNIRYEGMFYGSYIRKEMRDSIDFARGKKVYYVTKDTIYQNSYIQGISPSAGLSFTPTLYGMAIFGPKSKIQAIRHVLTPSVSYSLTPDIGFLMKDDYQRSYRDTSGKAISYSMYEGSVYGAPRLPVRSGSFTFSLGNNLEMKVLSAKDTLTGTKKIKLIESLNFSTSYNPYAKQYKLGNIGFNGSVPLYKDIRFSVNGSISPYDLEYNSSTGTYVLVDRYYWKKHKAIGRLTSASTSFGYSFQSGKGKQTGNNSTGGGPKGIGGQQNLDEQSAKIPPQGPVKEYSYFDIPWNFSFNYQFNYSKPLKVADIRQAVTFNGGLSLTKKWKISFTSGYDIKLKKFSPTNFTINRDLHCWAMSISVTPFGPYKYYSFRIAAISTLLQDLKYETHKSYYDYQYRQY